MATVGLYGYGFLDAFDSLVGPAYIDTVISLMPGLRPERVGYDFSRMLVTVVNGSDKAYTGYFDWADVGITTSEYALAGFTGGAS